MSEQSKVVKEYYPNGQIKYEIPYHQGQRHGIRKWWHENGQIWYETTYHQGQLHGIGKWWYEDGQFWYENYYLYDEQVTEEEYRKHELIESLACLNK